MVSGRTSVQLIRFPSRLNQTPCCDNTASQSPPIGHVSPIQQPFKQIPPKNGAFNRNTEVRSPGKEMIRMVEESTRRLQGAVVSRMQMTSQHTTKSPYYGWLLKARLEPMGRRKVRGPGADECLGILGCCKKHTPDYHPTKAKGVVRKKSPSTKPRTPQVDYRRKNTAEQQKVSIRSAESVLNKPYRKGRVMGSRAPAPVHLITVGRNSHVPLETKYKCLSAQFCGRYNVPGPPRNTSSPSQNVLVPRYGMFNAEECFVYEHDSEAQNSRDPAVLLPKDSVKSFNLELDYMLDKYDSDEEISPVQSEEQRIAHKYCGGGKIPGLTDWEDIVESIAEGALDMSGSQRLRKPRNTTKLRSPTIFTGKRGANSSVSCGVKPSDLSPSSPDRDASITWLDFNSLRNTRT